MTTPELPDPATYVGYISIPEGKSGKTRLAHRIVPAGEVMSDGDARTTIIGGQPYQRFKYDMPTRWHELSYEGGVWMTDIPAEQRQMRTAAQSMTGRVLIGGLGLGIFPTILDEMDCVDATTVVEKSRHVIKLVEPHLRTAKMTVIRDDLFQYLKALALPGEPRLKFTTAFFDIWQGDGQITFFDTVLPLLKLARKSRAIINRPLCWNEDVMRGQLFLSLDGNIAMLRIPGMVENPPPLAELATPRKNIWWDWKVPFWRAIQARDQAAIALDELRALARQYADGYGDPWVTDKFWRE